MNAIVSLNACPACKVAAGEPCKTPIDGVMTDWTHDARVYADLFADLRTKPAEPEASASEVSASDEETA